MIIVALWAIVLDLSTALELVLSFNRIKSKGAIGDPREKNINLIIFSFFCRIEGMQHLKFKLSYLELIWVKYIKNTQKNS